MMTEEEAKKRWCPMARVHISRSLSGSEYYSNNRLALHDLTTCIASGCMAWRTGESYGERFSGYCGLAGKQEAT